MSSDAKLKRMRRAQTDAWEAQATRDELVEWARQQERWPGRRFRVEGSRAGTSALTTEACASRLQTRCGGRVVTVIPTAKEDRLKQRKVAIP